MSAGPGAAGPAGGQPIVVLSSQRAFEALVGPVPEAWRSRLRFLKPARHVRLMDALGGARLVVSQSYFRPALNRWIFEARRRGVPTLLLVDGPHEWSNVHAARPGAAAARALHDPIVPDAVAAIGDAQARFIERRNARRGTVFFSYASQRIRTPPVSPAPTPEFDFLLTTARTAAFGAAEREALETALRACLAALVRAGHRTLVRLLDEDLREALRVPSPLVRFEATGSSAEAIARSRCVIGTPSSVLLEAMHHDRPTATLVFRDSPLFDRTGWLLGGFADWEASFASMLAREPARLAIQRDALRESLADQDLFTQLEPLLAGDALAAPRPLDARDLEFENHVLRQVAGLRARLLAPLYRAVREAGRGRRPPRS